MFLYLLFFFISALYSVACPGIRKGGGGGGGGKNLTKIAEKMILPTKKVAKNR